MKLFFKKLVYFLPIPLIICGINFFVDPMRLYIATEKQISQLLLKGSNVAYSAYYDDKLLQKYYINGISTAKEIVVVGSSRSMTIGSNLFPGRSFFNSSVSTAVLKDHMSIYWLYRTRGFVPSTMIIGLDPWILNKASDIAQYGSLEREYNEILNFISMRQQRHSKFQAFRYATWKYFELLSPSYFQRSIASLSKRVSQKNDNKPYCYATVNFSEDEQVIHSDGSTSFLKESRQKTAEEVRKISADVTNHLNFNKLDLDVLERLGKFLDLLSRDKVRVVFFLPPFHPKAYQMLISSEKYRIIVEAQKCFARMAKDRRIEIIGSYDPEDLSFTEADFYDAMHPKKEALDRYLTGRIWK